MTVPRLREHDVVLTDRDPTLRPLTEDDWDLVMHFNDDEEIGWFVWGAPWEPPELEAQQEIYRSISLAAHIFVIEVDGGPIGECWLQQMNLPRLRDRWPNLDLRRIDLTVREKQLWGRGYGSRVGPDDDEMAAWIRLRGVAFADIDWARPSNVDLSAEIQQRRLQEVDGAQMFLVDRGGTPAGIAAWYEGPDRFVLNLAVLPDHRGRGVGAAVMARAIAGAGRSTLVNTDEDNGPVGLYRRWGFTHEVYRRITYRRRAK